MGNRRNVAKIFIELLNFAMLEKKKFVFRRKKLMKLREKEIGLGEISFLVKK